MKRSNQCCHSNETISRDLCNLALLESSSYKVLLYFIYMCTKEVKCEISSLKGKFGVRGGAEGHNKLYSKGKIYILAGGKEELIFMVSREFIIEFLFLKQITNFAGSPS